MPLERDTRYLWELIGSGIVGAVAFPSLLAASQTIIFKPLRVSYSRGLSSSLLGLGSVAVASCGASLAALKTISIVQKQLPASRNNISWTNGDLVLSTLSGVLFFRALGGRFGAVLPSNLVRPGVFASEWIPAMRESELASPKERMVVKALGKKNGCHTCGRKRGVEFVADHQPPSKLVGKSSSAKVDPLLQRFYPQCLRCSNLQGGILSAGDGSLAFRHPTATQTHMAIFRTYHIFLPIPFLLAFFKEQTSMLGDVVSSRSEAVVVVDTNEPEPKTVSTSHPARSEEGKPPHVWVVDPDLIKNFPLLIVWRKLVHFLDSFSNPGDAFHVTLWVFTVIAALGTI